MKKLIFVLALAAAAAAQTPQYLPANGSKTVGLPHPTYDVTVYGAKGDGATDDTAAVQAAFTACYNNNVGFYGGVVQFPGARKYVISAGIDAYHGCSVEGIPSASSGGTTPASILWNGPATGTISQITQSAIASNVATITATNTLSAGEWVIIQGLTAGFCLNNLVAQVSATGLTTSQFEIPTGHVCTNESATSDSGTATTTSVAFYTDTTARYEQVIKGIYLNGYPGLPAANQFGVGFYFGSRVDSGTMILNDNVDSGKYFDYYFSNGGIDFEMDKGWRSDGAASVAMLYWRVGAVDSFSISNASLSAQQVNSNSGAYVMLDNSACFAGSQVKMTSRNIRMEVDEPFYPGYGGITLLDCPSNSGTQFTLDMEGSYQVNQSLTTAGFNAPSIVMSPPNESALQLTAINGIFAAGTGANNTTPFVGLPSISRNNMTGSNGSTPFISYSPPINVGQTALKAPAQSLNDVNINQLWQYKTQAADFLYSDTAFAALPNGTTLLAGQIVAPPSYWASTSATERYGLNVVVTAGTTGTPNNGQTTCTSPSSAVLNCTAPQATVTASSCSGTTLTFTVASGGSTFATGYRFWTAGTAESYLNSGPYTVLSSTSTSVSTNYACQTFTGNPSDTGTLTLSSTQDLSLGQHVSVAGIVTNSIIGAINAGNPANIIITLMNGTTVTGSPGALTYSAPVLGNEMQLLTKAAAAPTTGTWLQGDIVEDSDASATGVCGWVNTTGGSPGAWGNIYCGSGGAGITLTTTGSSGAATLAGSVLNIPIYSGGGGGGSVSSVALVGSGTGHLFSATAGTPVTSSGNLNIDSQLLTQAANCILAGPASGSAADPTCRTMVTADLPAFVAMTNLNNTFLESQTISPSSGSATLFMDSAKNWSIGSTLIGTFAIDDITDGVIPWTCTNLLCTFNVPVSLPTGSVVPLSTVSGVGTGVATALAINTGSVGAFGVLIGSGTAAMNTAAVGSGACETVVTVATSGVATTDTIQVGFNGDPTAVTGYGVSATGEVLQIYPYPTSGNVNFKVCNSTADSITPGALTLNFKVYR
jgi:hypothetical protein